MQLIALKTRSAAATNSGSLIFFPLLFLTPNFVPRDMLTRPMEIAATLNPVTYVMESLRSLILDDLDWAHILPGFIVVAVLLVVELDAQRAGDQPLRLSKDQGRLPIERTRGGEHCVGHEPLFDSTP